MDEIKRRWAIIVFLAALIVAGSFYGFWQKNATPESVAIVSQPDLSRNVAGSEAVVYISGAVNNPGMYKLKLGSRIVDAVDAAGGLTTVADGDKVNLAQPIKDGMHVHIPLLRSYGTTHSGSGSKGTTEKVAAADTGKNAADTPSAAISDKVNINTADKDALEKLPGVGPVLAGRIVDYRQANGPFREITALKAVSGIGEAKFNQLKDKVTL